MKVGSTPQLDAQLNTALQTAKQERLQALGAQAEDFQEDRAGLERAAKEFESVFLNTLLKAMRKTVPQNEFFNSDGPTKFYQQMYDAELAKGMATGSSGLGVADLIIKQFESRLDDQEASVKLKAQDTARHLQPSVGPPAPLQGPPEPSALQRYRAMSAVGEATAKLARLRLAATQQGTAVADTLQSYSQEIMDAAQETKLEPALILSVVMEESAGDPGAESRRGALGLMQLMPTTAAEVGVDDPREPAANLRGGARYLARMLEKYDNRLDLALAAYNAGPGTVDDAGRAVPDYPETQRYVERVTRRYEQLTGGTKLANGGP